MLSKHGSLESAILNVLWSLENKGMYKNSVKDVHLFLMHDSCEQRAYTTVKTVMDRLVLKKILLRFKNGKKYYYRTAYSCFEIVEKSLVDITRKYLNNDFNRLSDIVESVKNKDCLLVQNG